jgi:hypothetical protein
MQRSHTQTLYRLLPGAVFNHEDGFVATVDHITGSRSSGVNREVLLEQLGIELQRWSPDQIGIPDPRVVPGEFVFYYPEGVSFDVAPLLFECTNPGCKRVRRWFTQEQLLADTSGQQSIKCAVCTSKMRQLRYMTAHNCGHLQPLQTKRCPGCGDTLNQYLDDQGSFASSSWHCRNCGTEIGVRFTPCNCGHYGLPGRPIFQQGFTARDQRLWFPQTITSINISRSQTYDNLQRHSQRGLAVVASWLGDEENLAVSLADLERPGGGDRLTAAEWDEEARKMAAFGIDETTIESVRHVRGPITGGVGAITAEVTPAVVEAAQARVMVERAGLFDRHVTNRLSFSQVRATAGCGEAVALDRTAELLAALGVADISVTQELPIVVASYGYSRVVREPGKSDLKSYARPRHYDGKTPIFAVPADTEALLVTLDARAVLEFLELEKAVGPTQAATERDAKVALAEVLAADPELGTDRPAGVVRRLVHSASHGLLRALEGGQSGYGESSFAEWICPDALTAAIFVASYNEFTLGALDTVLRRRLSTWLTAAIQEMEHCDNDPLCSHVSPARPYAACDRCLYLSFGCRTWNADLDRRLLRRFWLFTQRRAQVAQT